MGSLTSSLFVPPDLSLKPAGKFDIRVLDNLPLATLEGKGDFRTALATAARKNGIRLNIQVEPPTALINFFLLVLSAGNSRYCGWTGVEAG